ncbi:MAG: hypothetical protein ACTSP6_08595 [Promethearchaeota archaeon]
MEFDIDQEIKITFIVGFIVAIIYGLWFLISVESWVAATNWPYLDPLAGRILGAILTSLAIVTLKSYKERDEWEKIENIVIFMAGFCILGAIMSIYSHVAFNLPAANIINIIIYIVLGILNTHIYIQKRK